MCMYQEKMTSMGFHFKTGYANPIIRSNFEVLTKYFLSHHSIKISTDHFLLLMVWSVVTISFTSNFPGMQMYLLI